MGPHTVDITKDTFQKTIEQKGIVLIDFWAQWCGPCRTFAPVFEKAAAKHGDIVFAKVNTEEQAELAAAFEIRSIPTLMVFRDGVLLLAQPGALPGNVLETLIGKVRAIDMEEVRREIEKQAAAGDGDAGKEH
jgi:thioredoxin 1